MDTKTPVLGRGRLRFAETSTKPLRPSDTSEDTHTLHISPGAAAVRLPLDQRYVEASLLGHGGMGTVYEVTERSLFRSVAMKVLRTAQRRPNDPHDQQAVELRSRLRFIEEAQINGQLEHPNIVPIYELGVDDDGTCFFTMKRVNGRTFDEFLKDEDVPNDRDALYEALQIFIKVCDALAFAHSRGVVHRDVKPSNIMVGEHGQVYLMDWGIALVLGSVEDEHHAGPVRVDFDANDTAAEGVVIGTLQYMSPEQATGEVAKVDTRSDVFSLGALLYRVITGRAPYVAETPEEIHEAAKVCDFPRPEQIVKTPLPAGLVRAAMRAMQPLEERTQTVDALREEIEEVLRGRWRFPTLHFAAGERILSEGEHGKEAYILRSGRCVAYRVEDGERVVLGEIHPGEVFGETALFTQQPRTADVEATEDSELFVVSEDVLSEELGLDSWRGAFVRTLGTRFTERSSRLTQLQRELAVERARRDIVLALVDAGGELGWEDVVARFVSDGGITRAHLDEAVANAPFLALEGEEDGRVLRLYASKAD